MKRLMIYLAAFLLALVMGSALPATYAHADDNTVITETELEAWLDTHDGLGGTVYLGDSITITSTISGGYGGGHVVIDTGQYGLVYDGGSLVWDDFEISGEGVDTPVVTVIDAGVAWYMGNWNNDLAFRFITATGRSGMGGVALYLTGDDGSPFDIGMIYQDIGCIRSYGAGAVGVLVDVPMDLYCFNVETDGENSLALSAPDGSVLYYCRLAASGLGAAAINGDVTLDTCIASPEPAGVTAISRTITDVSGKRFYLPIRLDDWIFVNVSLTSGLFWLSGSDGSEITRFFPVDWDWDALYNIDTSVLGSYTISGTLLPAFEGFGLTDGFPLELVVEVRDPSLPCISEVFFSSWSGNTATLVTWDVYDPLADGFILWRSDDGGETWYDFTDSPDLDWYLWEFNFIIFNYDALEHPVMFCLEVPGVGESNVVTLYEKDGMPFGDTGGDRTGTDWLGGNLPPDDPGDGNLPADDPSKGNLPSDDPSKGNLPSGDPGDTNNNVGAPVVGNNPAGGNPAGGNPAGGNPAGGNPAGGNPAAGNPAAGNPTGGNPAGGNPAGSNPTGSNPVGSNPAASSSTEGNPDTTANSNGITGLSNTGEQSTRDLDAAAVADSPVSTAIPTQSSALPIGSWLLLLFAAAAVLCIGAILWLRQRRPKKIEL